MKGIYRITEKIFEKIANVVTQLFSNSIVFLLAVILVIYWIAHWDWKNTTVTDALRDLILAITFLSFFIIQKTFSHFSQALHLKINELVAAHENARNHLVKAEDKSDEELKELAKEHDEIVEKSKKESQEEQE